ncbi:glycosyltransferase family 4 protein [Hansschlegelia quercus]|uniref:Glycosyltransferase family 1 protein n=1 Tax=Hansschlegelia quercus TaxID=2528245 RepID=A0A4Q9GFZ4_9HYPH|nr:glycosyltransferase family 4 protein [Hansschlegelia quercus]TBN47291.1 glycosyltransferase family 1 protein [Hansschlegelia quercus]
MKIACFVRPHMGGTFSVFRQLREGLAPHGFNLDWLASGAADVLRQDVWRDERSRGEVVDPSGEMSPRRRAEELARLISERRYDAVMLNVLGDGVETEVARYLPQTILRVVVVHNITPGTYAAAKSVRDNVHAAVCVSPRCRDDLVRSHGFDPERTILIPNAVDVECFAAAAEGRGRGDGLRLLFLGRIEDNSKGVMWLPRIVAERLPTTTVTIAGAGPDEAQLRRAFERGGDRVVFLGAVPPERVPALLAEHDVLLMPSRFEGAPMSLIEGMAAGCVPVASRIRGVTDAFVEHGQDGLLFPMGDWRAASLLIRQLENDEIRLQTLSEAARARALRGCRQDDMATAYASLFHQLQADPPPVAESREFDRWTTPAGLRRPLRSRAPEPIKNLVRLVRERLTAAR